MYRIAVLNALSFLFPLSTDMPCCCLFSPLTPILWTLMAEFKNLALTCSSCFHLCCILFHDTSHLMKLLSQVCGITSKFSVSSDMYTKYTYVCQWDIGREETRSTNIINKQTKTYRLLYLPQLYLSQLY